MKANLIKLSLFGFAILIACCLPCNGELRGDINDFLKLVPKKRVGYIAARHYILDEQFRIALHYLRSSHFIKTWSKIRNSQELADLIDYVRTRNVSLIGLQDVTGIIDKLPNQLRTFRIPAKIPIMMMMQRNFMSFMREVMQALPRARFYSLMARKVTEGGDFARLYKAVQQKAFKQLLAKAQTSDNLQSSWSDLRKNYIEVNDLIDVSFEILSWGP